MLALIMLCHSSERSFFISWKYMQPAQFTRKSIFFDGDLLFAASITALQESSFETSCCAGVILDGFLAAS